MQLTVWTYRTKTWPTTFKNLTRVCFWNDIYSNNYASKLYANSY